ncbi:hypothetical protein AN958_04120 [Leucoagaricus sp. SymC.cos]|nr:hypothetical protein AN958_04120 [Leucoagaricus sp. SymC.cos]
MAAPPPTNSLGLDFNGQDAAPPPQTQPPTENIEAAAPQPQSPVTEQPHREKKKPYVNPDRVKTGGPQREKLTDEELAERMARIREQNEKIKQRRLDVAADEAAFRQTQEKERQKQERTKKIQDNVDKAREQNIKRKMDKAQNREWDSGKPATTAWQSKSRNTPSSQEPTPADEGAPATDPSSPRSPDKPGSGTWTRGGSPPRGGRGRGRGRERGRDAQKPFLVQVNALRSLPSQAPFPVWNELEPSPKEERGYFATLAHPMLPSQSVIGV